MNKKTIKKIPADVFHHAKSKLDEIGTLLAPYHVVLSPPEKNAMVKIGNDYFEFLKLSHGLAVDCPGLFPAFMKASLFREEFFAIRELWTVNSKIDQLKSNISDMEMLAGNYALDTAMTFYQTVKIAARRDIPGARVIFEELKPAFPCKRQRRLKPAEDRDEGQLELF